MQANSKQRTFDWQYRCTFDLKRHLSFSNSADIHDDDDDSVRKLLNPRRLTCRSLTTLLAIDLFTICLVMVLFSYVNEHLSENQRLFISPFQGIIQIVLQKQIVPRTTS